MAEPATKESKVRLEDLLTYTPEQEFSESEIALLQSTFRNNNKLIKLLRKVFIQTISDPELPIEQFQHEILTQGRQWSQIPADEAKILFVAREDAIKFIFGGLIKLKMLANAPIEDRMAIEEKRKKDSTR